MKPKISIITVCFNAEQWIEGCIKSVLNQDYPNIEYIIIDGKSEDKTVEIVKKYTSDIQYFVSEKDSGLYDAMNKGIIIASGDVIGILNADDEYRNSKVLSNVMNEFAIANIDSVSSDVGIYKDKKLEKKYRFYTNNLFKPWMLRFGHQPAHPGFFIKKECYTKFGLYNTDFKIAADFDMFVRLILKHKISIKKMPIESVKMRDGGLSSASIGSRAKTNAEDVASLKSHGYFANTAMIWTKYLFKIFQIFFK